MIQDLGSHCYRNEYHPVPPKANDYILFFRDRKVLVKVMGDTFSFPDFQYTGEYYPGFIHPIPIYFPLIREIIILSGRNLWMRFPGIPWRTSLSSGILDLR